MGSHVVAKGTELVAIRLSVAVHHGVVRPIVHAPEIPAGRVRTAMAISNGMVLTGIKGKPLLILLQTDAN